MSLKERVAQKEADTRLRETATMQLYKEDKKFRADRLVEAWSRIPEIGAGLKQMPISDARNVAINLDRQTSFMQGLRESQLSTALNDFTPENMLRLVRLAMPNIIRNKVFTEFALETTKDSIKYIRPFFSKTANGHPLNDKSSDYDGFNDDTAAKSEAYDPWGYSKGGEFNGDDFRKALYEDTRDRANTELANAIVVGSDGATPATLAAGGGQKEFAFLFKKIDAATPAISAEAKFESGKWGKDGSLYVDGYTYIYGAKTADVTAGKIRPEVLEQQVIAIQDKGSGQFFAAPGFTVKITKSPTSRDKFLVAPPKVGPGNSAHWDEPVSTDPATSGPLSAILASTGVFGVTIEKDAGATAAQLPKWALNAAGDDLAELSIYAYGRYNSESDFEGNYLGEVEIRMDEYMFKPSPTSIGVSWSQLTEITLDTSFNISAEEYLVSYASQEIRSALDYRAIRLAYAVAKTNAKHNPNYYYEFDAAYNTSTFTPPTPATLGTKEGYIANAQTFVNAIDAIGDIIYDEINRGGVSRLVAGPSACSYMHLNSGYSPKGKQNQTGSHQFGELDDMPLFKVPSAIIPTNEILCVWKNDAVENDVSIAFGTLIPFFSTGIIQRKNFYKEAGLATYGDWAVLNRRYLAIIAIQNLKDWNNKAGV
jgi:hypothetical protein